MANEKPDRVIAVSRGDLSVKVLDSIKDADKEINPNLFSVYLLHGDKIYKATHSPAWGYIPRIEIPKTDTRYKHISEQIRI
jgi:hypothetical protein